MGSGNRESVLPQAAIGAFLQFDQGTFYRTLGPFSGPALLIRVGLVFIQRQNGRAVWAVGITASAEESAVAMASSQAVFQRSNVNLDGISAIELHMSVAEFQISLDLPVAVVSPGGPWYVLNGLETTGLSFNTAVFSASVEPLSKWGVGASGVKVAEEVAVEPS